MREIRPNLRNIVPLIVVLLLALPGWSQGVESLGSNPETELEEIRVNIPGLPEDAKPLEMVKIPAGTFTMGCPSDERGRYDYYDWLPHEVTLTRGFYLGKYEVTQAQWEAVLGSNPASGAGVGDDYPVHTVSWNDCQTFVETLNGMGLGTFRLPTEAEWEYACRAGTDARFSFGDALECADELDRYERDSYCSIMDEYVWWRGNNTYGGEQDGPKEVGRKLPNPWGLHNMHGNLWEWCSDWWDSPSDWWEPPYTRGPQVDPQGPSTGVHRATRGGGYYGNARNCRSAFRSYRLPDERYTYLGVRLVREYDTESTVESFTRY